MPRKTSQDFQEILNQLRENDPNLTNLDLSEYELNREQVNELLAVLEGNNRLTKLALGENLKFGGNQFDEDLKSQIEDLIRNNIRLTEEEFKTPARQIRPARPTRETTPQSPYQSKEGSLLDSIKKSRSAASKKLAKIVNPKSSTGKYVNEGIVQNPDNLRSRSGRIPFDAIDIGDSNDSKISSRKIKKNSGYDENFRLETVKELAVLDDEFKLNNPLNSPTNFKKAFAYSRLPTNSYIHFRGENGTTTGHSGGFFRPLGELEKVNFTKPKEKGGQGYEESIRTASDEVIRKLKRTQEEKTTGTASFHENRQSVIDKVIVEARAGSDELKKDSPVKATVEALKFVINDTVSYKDNTSENQARFKGITTDGLNLEDETQREYALKHYQAARDVMKLGVLKHEGRLNDVDSDGEDSGDEASEPNENVSPEIQRINRKLARTKLEEKFHDEVPEAKRNLSPLRSASPYSRTVITTAIEELRNADGYEEIARVYATPIPVLNPAESLIQTEERIRSTGRSRIGRPSQSENDSPIPPQPNFEEDAEKKSPEQQSSGGERTPSSSPTRSLGEKFSTPSSSRKI